MGGCGVLRPAAGGRARKRERWRAMAWDLRNALRPVVLAVVGAVLSVAPSSGTSAGPAEPQPLTSAPGPNDQRACRPSERRAYCSALCAPAQMVFLPCMAVGSSAMAACREREIRTCRRACRARAATC